PTTPRTSSPGPVAAGLPLSLNDGASPPWRCRLFGGEPEVPTTTCSTQAPTGAARVLNDQVLGSSSSPPLPPPPPAAVSSPIADLGVASPGFRYSRASLPPLNTACVIAPDMASASGHPRHRSTSRPPSSHSSTSPAALVASCLATSTPSGRATVASAPTACSSPSTGLVTSSW
ncbi:unnamed protein product, partial [Ectocarpus sp. 12 AP-2014]